MSGKFWSTIRDLRAGTTLDELDSAIAEVVTAVRATRKPGEIVLKIKIRPPKKDTSNYLTVEDDVCVKVPKSDRADTVFFPLADGSLSRSDPGQLPLGLKGTVDTRTGEIITREVASSEGGFSQ